MLGLKICCDIESIKQSKFGIWYLFLCTALLIKFESNANFIDLSLLTVITTGEKNWSLHWSNFSMYCSLINLSISFATSSGKFIGNIFPLWCVGLNFFFEFCFYYLILRPSFTCYLSVESLSDCFFVCTTIEIGWQKLLTVTFVGIAWLNVSPRLSNTSRPIKALWFFGTTVKSTRPPFHPFDSTSQ